MSDPKPLPETLAPARGGDTREALVRAAMEIFARDGFAAASTRAIAEAAGANQALISYHFEGKSGLYLAVFDHIASRFRQRLGPAAESLATLLEQPHEGLSARQRRERYLPALLGVTDRMAALLLSPETEQWAQLILREQARPTEAFELLYGGFMGRMMSSLTELILRLRGVDDLLGARLAVIGIYGQVLAWRAARASVMRHLQWTELTEKEIAIARAAVRRGVIAIALDKGTDK